MQLSSTHDGGRKVVLGPGPQLGWFHIMFCFGSHRRQAATGAALGLLPTGRRLSALQQHTASISHVTSVSLRIRNAMDVRMCERAAVAVARVRTRASSALKFPRWLGRRPWRPMQPRSRCVLYASMEHGPWCCRACLQLANTTLATCRHDALVA